MDAHDGLALRALVGGEGARRPAGQRRVARAARAGLGMQAFQRIDPRLEIGRQRVVGQRAAGEQGLAALRRHRRHGVEQRDVGRRAAVALVGVPALAMRVLHRQLAVGSERRLGPPGRRLAERRHVRDHQDLRHRRVHRLEVGERVAVVLDLGAEHRAQPDQQVGLVRDLVQAARQQEPAGLVEQAGQPRRRCLGRRHEGARALAARPSHRGAERGVRQRLVGFEPRAHGRAPPA